MVLSQILPFAANFVVILFFSSSWMSISTASLKNKMPRNFLQKRICYSTNNRRKYGKNLGISLNFGNNSNLFWCWKTAASYEGYRKINPWFERWYEG